MALYEVDSPINRDGRNNLNNTFADILRRFANLQSQIKVLAGGEEVDELIQRINNTINSAETTNEDLQSALVDAQQAITEMIEATIDTIEATDAANQATADATQVTNTMITLKNELEQLQTSLEKNITDATQATINANNATDAANQAATDAQQARSDADSAAQRAETAADAIEGWGQATPYQNGTTYNKNNVVTFNGSTYQTKRGGVTSLPTTSADWILLAQRGVDGSGAVSSVNSKFPDGTGNVEVGIAEINGLSDALDDKADGADLSQIEQEVADLDSKVTKHLEDFRRLEFKESLARTINPIFDGFIPAQQNLRSLQCMCYVKSDNTLVVGYSEAGSGSTDTFGDIVKFNLSNYTVISSKLNETLYHNNDITYNPITNELVIATLTDPLGSNRLEVYDYSNLTKKSTKIINGVNSLAALAYNEEIDKYVAYVTGGIAVISNSFVKEHVIPLNKYPNSVLQTMETFGNLIFIYWDRLIQVIDFEGNLIREWYFPVNNEAGGISYLKNGDFLISQKTPFSYRYTPRTFKFNMYQELNISDWSNVNSLLDLGLVEGSETIQGISVSLSNKSILRYLKTTSNSSNIYPEAQGIMEVTKIDLENTSFTFKGISGVTYEAYVTNAGSKFSGWTKTFDLDSKANTIPDADNLIVSGEHYVFNTTLNLPESASGYMKVKHYNDNYVRQKFSPSYASGQHFYIRNKAGGAWGPWHSFYAHLSGSGSPEGVLTGRVGNLYTDTTNEELYFKSSGIGNKGWKLVSSS